MNGCRRQNLSVACSCGDTYWHAHHLQVFTNEGLIYMVQEYGEIDLARLLAKHEAARQQGVGGGEMDENFVRLYWQQMLKVGGWLWMSLS